MVKLRNRDIGAAILAVILARMAWTDNFGPESLSATVNLAFYAPYKSLATNPRKIERLLSKPGVSAGAGFGMAGMTLQADLEAARPVPLDVDGDGTVEALVVPAVLKNRTVGDADGAGRPGQKGELAIEWGLRVLDLKPMHAARTPSDEMAIFPFSPRVMFESKPVIDPPVGIRPVSAGGDGDEGEKEKEEGAAAADEADRYLVPLRMSTGQLYLTPGPPKPEKKEFVESDDRTRHYFCGRDWHDAARRCGTPCKSGTATDCPDGEQCYADTPCDSEVTPTPAPTPDDGRSRVVLVKTPDGGMPSVVTAWSDGSVTLHSITGEFDPAQRRKKKGKKKRKGEPDPDLELRLMWRSRPFKEEEKDEEKKEGEDGEKKDEEKKPDAGGPSSMLKKSQELAAKQITFKELDLTLDSDAPLGQNGAVLFAARIVDGVSHSSSAYFALDARNGEVLWSHRGKAKPLFPWMNRNRDAAKAAKPADKATEEAKKSLEDEKRMTGLARRRSHLVDILGAGGGDVENEGADVVDDVLAAEDCLLKYRHWVLDPSTGVLPHLHWGGGSQHARLHVAHFDRRHGQHEGRQRSGALQGGRGILPPVGKKKKKGGRGGEKSRPTDDRGWQKKFLVAPRRKAAEAPGGGGANKGHGGKKKHHKHSRSGPGNPIHAKPNVLLFHHEDGLSVLSLRNGRPVCHLSLVDDSLYDDLNGDGVIDEVQVLRGGLATNMQAYRNAAKGMMGSMAGGMMGGLKMQGDEEGSAAEERKKESAKFAGDLIERIAKEQAGEDGEEGKKDKRLPTGGGSGALCHAMVLSGLPAKEMVFRAQLCDPAAADWNARRGKEEVQDAEDQSPGARAAAARARRVAQQKGVGAAPPLAVESLHSLAMPGERDVIFAVGTGSVSRYNPFGENVWTTARRGPDEEGGIPTWDGEPPLRFGQPSYANPAFLDRIDFAAAYRAGSPAVRPIIVSGEDGLAILSAGKGRVLASASYPQAAASRPLLTDVSGDGTTDLVVVSADGVWGYKVRVETGGSRFLRIAVGLLLLGIGAAALRNKFSQPPGVDRRSTDF